MLKPATQKPFELTPSYTADVVLPLHPCCCNSRMTEKMVLIGASTGGTEAIKAVLTALPAQFPPILIAQHMPEVFTKSFADRLNTQCALTVKEAEEGEMIKANHVYIAPGFAHLMLQKRGMQFFVALSRGNEVNRHRPSVDVLFRSGANMLGAAAIGVILTGMGRDGARGLAELRQTGAYTIAQNEASCVVFGMPKEAIALGGVAEVLSIEHIAPRLLGLLTQQTAHIAR